MALRYMRPADIGYVLKSASVYGLAPARELSDLLRKFYDAPFSRAFRAGRYISAVNEMFERASRQYEKRPFGFGTETVVQEKAFSRLIRFDESRLGGHKLLIVAPLSGHFATLLRGTIEPMLRDFEVYITDWTDARDVSLDHGRFGLDDYIDYLRDFMRELGSDTSVLAVCQPGVPTFAAISLMEMDGEACTPITATFMGSPIDVSQSPTEVNALANARGLSWFEEHCIARVPFMYKGCGRDVYPGFMQLFGFMAMNIDKHIGAHLDLFDDLYRGDNRSAEKRKDFYDEYMAGWTSPRSSIWKLSSAFF